MKTLSLNLFTSFYFSTVLCLALTGCFGGDGDGATTVSGGARPGSGSADGLSLVITTIDSKTSAAWATDGSGNVAIKTNAFSLSGTCSRGISKIRSKTWQGASEPSSYDSEIGSCSSAGYWSWTKTVATNASINGQIWHVKLFGAVGESDSDVYTTVTDEKNLLLDVVAPTDPVVTILNDSTSASYSSTTGCEDQTTQWVCRQQYIEIVGTWNDNAGTADSYQIVVTSPASGSTVLYPTSTTFKIRVPVSSGTNVIHFLSRDLAGNDSTDVHPTVLFQTELSTEGFLATNVYGTSSQVDIGSPVCSGSNCNAPDNVQMYSVNSLGASASSSLSDYLFNLFPAVSESP